MKAVRVWAAMAGLLTMSSTAEATNYSLWVHGYSPLVRTPAGNYNDFSYFGPASRNAGVNKRSVNWNGQDRLATTNVYIQRAFDCYCTGSNWCYVAGHSTGDAQIAYALAQYGGSQRSVKVPDTGGPDGTCQNVSSGATQPGWNIKWIDVSGGAAGGSELAPIGHWVDRNTDELIDLSHPILIDLDPANARPAYNHNETRSLWFYMFAGAKGVIGTSNALPGQDDQVVAYHSTGAISGNVQTWCNPAYSFDLFCYGELTTGTSAASGWWFNSNRAKWSRHTVQFRDTWESYAHLPWSTALGLQDWGEIISLQREDMVTYAY